jgi:hypothetical protein
MGFTQKGQPFGALDPSAVLPGSMPAPPPFNSQALNVWSGQLNSWWSSVSLVLTRQYQGVVQTQAGTVTNDAFTSGIATLTAEYNALQASVTALQTQFATQTGNSGANTVAIAALSAQVATLMAQAQVFSAHIASDVAHGTTSAIVGESDAQPLDNKTIGGVAPGAGFFSSLMNQQTIPAGQTVTVQSGYSMVIAQPVSIGGTLNVSGTAVFL